MPLGRIGWGRCLAGVGLLWLTLSGCQTTGTAAGPGTDHTTRIVSFHPTAAKSGLHLGEGRYPDLFASSSYACWAGVDANAPASEQAEAMANALGDRFAVIEIRVESTFSDMDKAYEVVGLRGVNAYLLTSEGEKIRPTKVVTGQELDETSVGALRHFGRTNLLVFPTEKLSTMVTGVSPPAPVVQLVLEGYDTAFYYAWATHVPPPDPEKYPELKSRLRSTQQDLRIASERFMEVSHRFD